MTQIKISILNRSIILYLGVFLIVHIAVDLELYARLYSRYLGIKFANNPADYQTGILYFESRRRLDPRNATHRKNLGIGYYHLGDYNKSIEYYLQAVALNPGELEYYKDLFTIYNTVDHAKIDPELIRRLEYIFFDKNKE